jgi:hypothetical protein
MTDIIIKQPNDKFAIWNTDLQFFSDINCTEVDLMKIFIMKELEIIKRRLNEKVVELKIIDYKDQSSYYRGLIQLFTKQYPEIK